MMKYIGVIERPDTITIDGYSTAKTVNGAIVDFGRYITKYFSKSEGEALIQYKSECLLVPQDDNKYFLTTEKVPCASNWNEDTEEMEYTDGNYYLCIRFITQ